MENHNKTGEEQSLDAFALKVGKLLQKRDDLPFDVNIDEVGKVLLTYELMKDLMKASDAEVSYMLFEPFRFAGSVTVVGKNIVFRKKEWFLKAVEMADNFEVIPGTDKKVRLDFSFNNLTKTTGRR